MRMQTSAASQPRLSASWPEEKESAGDVTNRNTYFLKLRPRYSRDFWVGPSRIALSKDTKMIVDMWQMQGFEQKETKTDFET